MTDVRTVLNTVMNMSELKVSGMINVCSSPPAIALVRVSSDTHVPCALSL